MRFKPDRVDRFERELKIIYGENVECYVQLQGVGENVKVNFSHRFLHLEDTSHNTKREGLVTRLREAEAKSGQSTQTNRGKRTPVEPSRDGQAASRPVQCSLRSSVRCR